MSRYSKRTLSVICSAIVFAVSVKNATAVNSTTINPITGHKPQFQDNIAGQKLGFEKTPGVYFNKVTNPDANFIYDGALSKLPELVKVAPFADGDYSITDSDGDINNPEDAFLTVKNLGVKLLDSTGAVVNLENLTLTDTICDVEKNTIYVSPFSFVVSAVYVPATKQGLPQSGDDYPITQTYPIDIAGSCAKGIGKIKYVMPSDSSLARNVKAGTNFVKDKGFTYDAGFPTIGFEGASFTFGLEGTTDPNLYTLESSDLKVATVDAKNVVQLVGKGAATISVKLKGSSFIVDTYSFNVNTWLQVPKLNGNVCSMAGTGTNNCISNCASVRGTVPFVELLTNASVKIGTGNQYLIRQMDDSLFGQWGNISKYNDARNKPGYINGSYISMNMPDNGAGYYAATSQDGRVSVQAAGSLGLGLLCVIN